MSNTITITPTLINDPLGAEETYSNTGAFGINDAGTIVVTGVDGQYRSYEYDDGAYSTIPTAGLGSSNFVAYGINDDGVIVGDIGNTLGIIDTHGQFQTISAFGDPTQLFAMNDSGEAVGSYQPMIDINAGFIYDQGTITKLNDPLSSDNQTEPNGINDSGEIVGGYISANGRSHGFTYFNGIFTTVDYPGAADTGLVGISNNGMIVGYYGDGKFPDEHGFIDVDGSFTSVNLAGYNGADSVFGDINDSGQVVGFELNADDQSDAFTAQLPSPLCFLHGTRILTPNGPVPVEDLAIGDAVVTRFSGIRRIKFLGRQSYAPHFIAANPEKSPVRIRAGALGHFVPARDLLISPGHSMLLGETLMLAKTLVNGVTITQARPETQVNYIHIDIGAHDCVLAEGAWAETYADAPGMRAQFHNAAAFHALYPNEPPPAELRLCAPRPQSGPRLIAALMPVVARAAVTPGPLEGWLEHATDWKVIGWARDLAYPTLPVLLEILVANRVIGTALACLPRPDLYEAGKGNSAFSFTPPFRLRPEALATLTVRRAADAATLRRLNTRAA